MTELEYLLAKIEADHGILSRQKHHDAATKLFTELQEAASGFNALVIAKYNGTRVPAISIALDRGDGVVVVVAAGQKHGFVLRYDFVGNPAQPIPVNDIFFNQSTNQYESERPSQYLAAIPGEPVPRMPAAVVVLEQARELLLNPPMGNQESR